MSSASASSATDTAKSTSCVNRGGARVATASPPMIAHWPTHEPPLDPGLDLFVARPGVLAAHPLPVQIDTEVCHLNRQPEPLRLRRIQ
jgi:hypothetical protein